MGRCDYWWCGAEGQWCELKESSCECEGSDAECSLHDKPVALALLEEERTTLQDSALRSRRGRLMREAS